MKKILWAVLILLIISTAWIEINPKSTESMQLTPAEAKAWNDCIGPKAPVSNISLESGCLRKLLSDFWAKNDKEE